MDVVEVFAVAEIVVEAAEDDEVTLQQDHPVTGARRGATGGTESKMIMNGIHSMDQVSPISNHNLKICQFEISLKLFQPINHRQSEKTVSPHHLDVSRAEHWHSNRQNYRMWVNRTKLSGYRV